MEILLFATWLFEIMSIIGLSLIVLGIIDWDKKENPFLWENSNVIRDWGIVIEGFSIIVMFIYLGVMCLIVLID